MHTGASAFFLIGLVLAATPCADASELDISYRADQPSFRIHPAATGAQLPRLLEEYAPPPPPISTASEPAPATASTGPFVYAWDRVRAGFALPALESPLVVHWQKWYSERPELMQAMFERGRRYIYHVVEELDKRKLPTELAFLPMVESGYNPMALSSAQAAGLWQFIPSTGKAHDLKQSLLVDARRDIIASTAAALTYLQTLFERFGDWQLALAAYNSGENAVAKAIARNKAKGLPTDYKALDLPEETRNYLPKLQALKNIVANPRAFNFRIDPVPNKPYFAAIASERYIDVDVAAKLAGVTLEEFLALNPSFNLNLVSKGPRARILLPVEKIDAFISNLDNYKEPPKRNKPGNSKTTSTPNAGASAGGAGVR
ncbi:MAG: transglycosylase SLT domain-containing protein [Burkholderiales bacterium]|nr:transglycosylase SLT domain-containing protein [Burkholderiales bacterium]